jgi:hypothetical protein
MSSYIYRTWRCMDERCHVSTSSEAFAKQHENDPKYPGHKLEETRWTST